jgi:hypothetical protein
MACDLCGKRGTHLAPLLSIYKTDDVQEICPECEKVVNKQLSKIQSMTTKIIITLMKRFLGERKQ